MSDDEVTIILRVVLKALEASQTGGETRAAIKEEIKTVVGMNDDMTKLDVYFKEALEVGERFGLIAIGEDEKLYCPKKDKQKIWETFDAIQQVRTTTKNVEQERANLVEIIGGNNIVEKPKSLQWFQKKGRGATAGCGKLLTVKKSLFEIKKRALAKRKPKAAVKRRNPRAANMIKSLKANRKVSKNTKSVNKIKSFKVKSQVSQPSKPIIKKCASKKKQTLKMSKRPKTVKNKHYRSEMKIKQYTSSAMDLDNKVQADSINDSGAPIPMDEVEHQPGQHKDSSEATAKCQDN